MRKHRPSSSGGSSIDRKPRTQPRGRHGGSSSNTSILNKMMEAAVSGEMKWTKVLQYIESHCVDADDEFQEVQGKIWESMKGAPLSPTSGSQPPPFDNAPFLPDVQPSDELRKQLLHDEEGNSMLRKAVLKSAPFRIVASLCQLCPEPLMAGDRRGRLPLHHACRLPVNDHSQRVLLMLLQAAPKALLHRDEGGRTPLHYLLWFHAQNRTPDIVQTFCCKLPKQWFLDLKQQQSSSSSNDTTSPKNNHDDSPPLPDIPTPCNANKVTCNSAIIPDAKHGCLPLHYAVMEGATEDVLKVLLKAYPLSKHLTDRFGRTALHWYMGAAYLYNNNTFDVDTDQQQQQQQRERHSSSSNDNGGILHVSGEAVDPEAQPWYNHKVDPNVVELLISSRVARTADTTGRSPLHWAAHYWACHYFYKLKKQQQQQQQERDDGIAGEEEDYNLSPKGSGFCSDTRTGSRKASSRTPRNTRSGSYLEAFTFQQATDPLSVSTVKIILDHHVGQLTCRDALSLTPLMVFFDSTARLQEHEYLFQQHQQRQAAVTERDDHNFVADSTTGDGEGCSSSYHTPVPTFSVPRDCVSILLDCPDSSARKVATVEDCRGRLPVHAALEVAAPSYIIQPLIESHPAALLHMSAPSGDDHDGHDDEEDVETALMMVPLHSAFRRKCIAPLQTSDIIETCLDSYKITKHGSLVDGRLALKMEDSIGYYPLHWACQNGASLHVITTMVDAYPKAALLQLPDGSLPLHCLVNHNVLYLAMTSLTSRRQGSAAATQRSQDSNDNVHGDPLSHPAATTSGSNDSDTTASASTTASSVITQRQVQFLEGIREKMRVLIPPILAYYNTENNGGGGSSSSKLKVACPIFGLLPLHIAVLFRVAPYSTILRMLELYPQSAMQYTSGDMAFVYSCLDLHDIAKSSYANGGVEDWYRIRELLFSFAPTLESHRHRQDLLDRSIHVIVSEIRGLDDNFSYHRKMRLAALESRQAESQQEKMKKEDGDNNIELTHSLSSNLLEKTLSKEQLQMKRRMMIKKRWKKGDGSYGGRKEATDELMSVDPSIASASNHDHHTKKGRYSRRRGTTEPYVCLSPKIDNNNTEFNNDNTNSDDNETKTTKCASSSTNNTKKSVYDDDDVHLKNFVSDTEYDDDDDIDDDDDDDDSNFSGRSHEEEGGAGSHLSYEVESYFDYDNEVVNEGGLLSGVNSGEEGRRSSGDDRQVEAFFGSRSSVSGHESQSLMDSRTQSSDALLQAGTTQSSGFVDRVFIETKKKLMQEEEKKDECDDEDEEEEEVEGCEVDKQQQPNNNNKRPEQQQEEDALNTKKFKSKKKSLSFAPHPEWASEVGLRLWTFFALYVDSNNPNDNYAKQCRDIFDQIEYRCVEKLANLRLPPFSVPYLHYQHSTKTTTTTQQHHLIQDLKRMTFREAANPKCRELIHRAGYFLGRFDLNGGDDGNLLLLRGRRFQQSRGSGSDTSNGTNFSNTNSSVIINAYEWTFTTEEDTSAKSTPGVSEDTIWRSGEIPNEIGLTFKTIKRPVVIHFTQLEEVYLNEVTMRQKAGSNNNILPIANHYNANLAGESKENLMYLTDTQDERFKALELFNTHSGGVTTTTKMTGKSECDDDSGLGDTITLADYPFAMVYPRNFSASLFEYCSSCGIKSTQAIRKVGIDIGNALKQLHANGIVHSNVCLDNILLASAPTASELKGDDGKNNDNDESSPSQRCCWYLSDLSFTNLLVDQDHNDGCNEDENQNQYYNYGCSSSSPLRLLGEISSDGYSQFATGTLPPEMFVRLTPPDVRMYRRYWDYVENKLKIKFLDRECIEPKVDVRTGETYCVRCHFVPLTESAAANNNHVPKLPYDLLKPSIRQDLWGYGLVLFHLCAGRPLFPINNRSGHLLSYNDICHWDVEMAKDYIYQHVDDHRAQDLLLQLLAPQSQQQNSIETVESILCHPFFSSSVKQQQQCSSSTSYSGTGSGFFNIEKRKIEANAHKRKLQTKLSEVAENVMLEKRTDRVDCWDFDILKLMYNSPTEIVKRLIPDQQWRIKAALPFPCAIVVLPYQIIGGGEGQGSSDSNSSGNHEDAFGIEYLKLSKACYFATVMKKWINLHGRNNTRPKWSCTMHVLDDLGLSKSDFVDVELCLTDLASKHVELFRSDPVSVAMMVVQNSIINLFKLYEDSGAAYLYLIDEYRCVPVVNGGNNDNERTRSNDNEAMITYPIEVKVTAASDDDVLLHQQQLQKQQDLLRNSLLFMHLCSLCARGVKEDITGLAELFGCSSCCFDQAGRGLLHELNERHFVVEINILQDALSDLPSFPLDKGGNNSSSCRRHRIAADDLNYVQEFLFDVDPKRTFANMRRVSTFSDDNMCLWTTASGLQEIESISRTVTFRDVLDRLDKVEQTKE